ncbi:histone-lysine N-methyltransferase SETMAR-like [Argiope bruennichi]|uniref:histone-lysine N-methyltransferase SETMAR-like n=1 Tax=Argiope bruennichi TaxID=94029 RepID=UPI002494356B|nr:histone-lysine N-methyltransferase SETMAR-like [Argiope bruennichi]
MECEKEHIRHCLLYEFDKKSTAAAAHHNLCQVYGEDTIDESTCRRWFRKFREGDRSCQDQARSGRPSQVEDDIDIAIRNNPSLTVQELAETFNVHWRTAERRLVKLGFTRKLDLWVSHNLTANQQDVRIATCVSLLSRYKNAIFLRRIVTGDEKWVMYCNLKRRSTVCRSSDPLALISKAEFPPKKMLLNVWWVVQGIIH